MKEDYERFTDPAYWYEIFSPVWAISGTAKQEQMKRTALDEFRGDDRG